jgi:hypothetical protein
MANVSIHENRQAVFECKVVDYNRPCQHGAHGSISPVALGSKRVAQGRVHCWWAE